MLKRFIILACIVCLLFSLSACSSDKAVSVAGTDVSVEFVSIEQLDSTKDLDLGKAIMKANGNDFYLVRMKGKMPGNARFHLISDSVDAPIPSMSVNDNGGFDMHASVPPGQKPIYLALESYQKSDDKVVFKYYDLNAGKWIDESAYEGVPAERYDMWGVWD